MRSHEFFSRKEVPKDAENSLFCEFLRLFAATGSIELAIMG